MLFKETSMMMVMSVPGRRGGMIVRSVIWSAVIRTIIAARVNHYSRNRCHNLITVTIIINGATAEKQGNRQ
jgi:hypothetical protein